jgi:hypothetical protein
MLKVGSSSPWGKIDQIKEIAKGIIQVYTPGHGGYKVYAKLNRQIPEYMRNDNGWYEEDCEIAHVQVVFPQFFKPEHVVASKESLKNYNPDAYEKFYGIALKPGESNTRDRKIFEKETENKLVVTSAFGDWEESVPKGMIGVYAAKGGYRGKEYSETLFLVPAFEYENRSRFGFVIEDENKYPVWVRK